MIHRHHRRHQMPLDILADIVVLVVSFVVLFCWVVPLLAGL